MKETRVKAKIKEGQMAFMASVDMADPALVEIIGLAGYDAVFIDIEHSAFDFQLVEEMIRAADAVGIDAIVRIPENNPKTIGRVLDMGAEGIFIPHIKGREDALAAVQAVRYAPLGKRGMSGPSRAMQYGAVPMAEHKKTSNNEIMLTVMIEDKDVIPEAEAIASVDGLDFICVGPSCMSLSLNVGPDDPKLLKALEDISAAVRKADKAKMGGLALNHSVLPMNAAQLRELGAVYAMVGGASSRLLSSFREQLKEYRAQLS